MGEGERLSLDAALAASLCGTSLPECSRSPGIPNTRPKPPSNAVPYFFIAAGRFLDLVFQPAGYDLLICSA